MPRFGRCCAALRTAAEATLRARGRYLRMQDTDHDGRPDRLHAIITRNIEAMEHRRRRQNAGASRPARVAEAMTAFAGSMRFVYVHLAFYGAWILLYLGAVPGVRHFDASFGTLSMIASVEAIFLSTFVLIAQNRMAEQSDQRADLDLHISLLCEHELTRLAALVASIGAHLGVEHADAPEIDELQREVAPEAVLDALAARRES